MPNVSSEILETSRFLLGCWLLAAGCYWRWLLATGYVHLLRALSHVLDTHWCHINEKTVKRHVWNPIEICTRYIEVPNVSSDILEKHNFSLLPLLLCPQRHGLAGRGTPWPWRTDGVLLLLLLVQLTLQKGGFRQGNPMLLKGDSNCCCCTSPKQGSTVLFPGALPLASAGVGGYSYVGVFYVASPWFFQGFSCSLTQAHLQNDDFPWLYSLLSILYFICFWCWKGYGWRFSVWIQRWLLQERLLAADGLAGPLVDQAISDLKKELERGFLNAATASGEEELDSSRIFACSHWPSI